MIGKDGRKLSKFQGKAWMKRISKNRRYLNQARGEDSGVAKLTAGKVYLIRHPQAMPQKTAKFYAKRYGVSIRYVYALRQRKTWKHI